MFCNQSFGRVSGGVYGIKVGDRKGSGGGFVAGMVSINNSETPDTYPFQVWNG